LSLLQPRPPPPVATATTTSVVIAAGHSKNLAMMISAIQAWCVQEKYGLRDFIKVRALFFLPERKDTLCACEHLGLISTLLFIVRMNEIIITLYIFSITIISCVSLFVMFVCSLSHTHTHTHHIKKNILISTQHIFL
jgi:hypothetical protein